MYVALREGDGNSCLVQQFIGLVANVTFHSPPLDHLAYLDEEVQLEIQGVVAEIGETDERFRVVEDQPVLLGRSFEEPGYDPRGRPVSHTHSDTGSDGIACQRPVYHILLQKGAVGNGDFEVALQIVSV